MSLGRSSPSRKLQGGYTRYFDVRAWADARDWRKRLGRVGSGSASATLRRRGYGHWRFPDAASARARDGPVRTIVVVLTRVACRASPRQRQRRLWYVRATNLSALPQPHPAEARLARAVRRFAVPASHPGAAKSDTGLTSDVVAPAVRTLPIIARAVMPTMAAATRRWDGICFRRRRTCGLPATQSLTDGELFWIIENGVRFTGMPGWSTGTKEGEAASWHLVHFIRHLPAVTEAELEDMAGGIRDRPEEVRQEIEAERFLRGEDVR